MNNQIIQSDRLILIPLSIIKQNNLYPNYLEKIHALMSHDNVTKYAIWDCSTIEGTQRYIDRRFNSMYVVLNSNHFIGLGILHLSGSNGLDNSIGSVGYYISPEFWGNGYATEICSKLINHAFNNIPTIHKVIATCDPNNQASQKVLLKSGMNKDGIIRHDVLTDKGYWRDSQYFSILKDEYYTNYY